MELPLIYDLRCKIFSLLPARDLRNARLVCRGFREESEDAFYRGALDSQFERTPAPATGASPKEAYTTARANSKAATHRYRHSTAKDGRALWAGVGELAPQWADSDRLAVASAFWKVASRRLQGPRVTLREVVSDIEHLLRVLPKEACSPLCDEALRVLKGHEGQLMKGAHAPSTAGLKARLLKQSASEA